MLLYIVRHAWAEERDEEKYADDSFRPLTKAGRERFNEVTRKLAARGIAPQVIATSPLTRCRQTAEILAAGLDVKPPILEWSALAPDSDLATLAQATNELSATEVAWVGHAPDVSELLAGLISGGDVNMRFAKGAVAAIEFEDEVNPGQGELQWLTTAKMLGC